MNISAIVNPKPTVNPKTLRASLTLVDESGKEYGPLLFQNFEEVAARLRREAGVPHEQLQECYFRHRRGEEVRISLELEKDAAIERLGFSSTQSANALGEK